MPRKIILLSILAIRVIGAMCAVDLTAVEVDTKMNPGQYNSLLERFINADTTMTEAELSAVYYGYAFTPSYDPREIYPEVSQAYESGDYKRALDLASEALTVNPVSLSLNVTALAAAHRLCQSACVDPTMVNTLGHRCDLLATAILKSGSGTTPDSPFVVIDETDINKVLRNILGIDSIVDRTKVGSVLAFKVTFSGSSRQHILYFDNTPQLQFIYSLPSNDKQTLNEQRAAKMDRD